MDDIVSAIQSGVEANVLQNINTCMPGEIVSFNPATVRAVCRPLLKKILADGQTLEPPQIVEVPVIFPVGMGGTAGMSFPLRAGDGVSLHFSQRSMEGFLQGDTNAPDDPRQFDLTDAVAVPGLRSASSPIDADNVRLFFGSASLALTPGGKLIIDAPGGVQFVTSGITSNSDATFDGISIVNHRHRDVETGGGQSGVPVK